MPQAVKKFSKINQPRRRMYIKQPFSKKFSLSYAAFLITHIFNAIAL